MPEKPKTGVRRALTLARVARDARLDRNYILLVALSASIATLGMLMNSTVVVIGAMLVSPLMGPIMGIGFGLAIFDNLLIKRSVSSLLAGMLVAIAISALIIFVSPIRDVTNEISSRTHPSLFDLGIAVVGGIAGVFAILRQNSGVMVGVAIATTLMPPLSTMGFGIVTNRPDFALGAGLLFLTNALTIALTATVMARISRFGPSLSARQTALQSAGIIGVLGVLSIPLAISLNSIVLEVQARAAVRNELETILGPDARVSTLQIARQAELLTVDAVAIVPRYRAGADEQLQRRIRDQLNRKVKVTLTQIASQSGESDAFRSGVEQRIAALERQDAQATKIIETLMAGGISRDAIMVDVQARRIVVQRQVMDTANDNNARAIAQLLTETQRAHPNWLILTGDLEAAEDGEASENEEASGLVDNP